MTTGGGNEAQTILFNVQFALDPGNLPAGAQAAAAALNQVSTAQNDLNQRQQQSQQTTQNNAAAHRQLAVDLINASNAFRTVVNALGEINPAMQATSQFASGVVSGMVGIVSTSASTALGIASVAAAGLELAVNLGKADEAFANQQVRLQAMLGLSAQSALNYDTAIQLSGGHTNDLAQFTIRLSSALDEIAKGRGTEAAAALQRLGVEAVTSTGHVREMGDILPEVLQKLGSFNDKQEQEAILADIMGGRFAKQLLPFIRDYNDYMQGAVDITARHIDLTEDLDAKMKAYNATQRDIALTWQDLANNAGPAYLGILRAIDGMLGAINEEASQGFGLGKTPEVGSAAWLRQTGLAGKIQFPGAPGSGNPIIEPGTPGYSPPSPDMEGPRPTAQGLKDLQDEADNFVKSLDKAMKAGVSDANRAADLWDGIGRKQAGADGLLFVLDRLTSDLPHVSLNMNDALGSFQSWSAAANVYDTRLQNLRIQTDLARAAEERLALSGQQYTVIVDNQGRSTRVLTDAYQTQENTIATLRAATDEVTAAKLREIDATKKQAQAMLDYYNFVNLGTAQARMGAMAAGGALVQLRGPNGEFIGVRVNPGQTVDTGGGTITDINGGNTGAPNPPVPYAQGTGFVPNDGLAFLHQGERVVTASENAQGGGGGVVLQFVNNGVMTDGIDQLYNALMQLQRSGRLRIVQ